MKKVITGIGLVIDLTTFVVIARLDGRKAAEEKLQDFEDYITRLEASAAVPLTPLAGAGSAAAAELNEMMDIMNAGEREALKQTSSSTWKQKKNSNVFPSAARGGLAASDDRQRHPDGSSFSLSMERNVAQRLVAERRLQPSKPYRSSAPPATINQSGMGYAATRSMPPIPSPRYSPFTNSAVATRPTTPDTIE